MILCFKTEVLILMSMVCKSISNINCNSKSKFNYHTVESIDSKFQYKGVDSKFQYKGVDSKFQHKGVKIDFKMKFQLHKKCYITLFYFRFEMKI